MLTDETRELYIEEPGTVGDNLRATVNNYDPSESKMYIEVENPWSGDTESGFGRSGSIRLSKDQARMLADFLSAWAAS